MKSFDVYVTDKMVMSFEADCAQFDAEHGVLRLIANCRVVAYFNINKVIGVAENAEEDFE